MSPSLVGSFAIFRMVSMVSMVAAIEYGTKLGRAWSSRLRAEVKKRKNSSARAFLRCGRLVPWHAAAFVIRTVFYAYSFLPLQDITGVSM